MTALPVQHQTLVDSCVDQARTILRDRGNLQPMAFLRSGGGSLGLVPLGMCPNTDEMAALIRAIAKMGAADFAMVIMEAWVLSGDDPVAMEAARRRYKSLEDAPGRFEAVSVMVETPQGVWTGVARQQTDGAGRKTFGALEFRAPDRAEGRFVGLLPNKEKPS